VRITALDIRGYRRCKWGGIKPRRRVTWLLFTRLMLLCTGFVRQTTNDILLVRELLAAAGNRWLSLTIMARKQSHTEQLHGRDWHEGPRDSFVFDG
jgi:hypothetical protein